MAETNPGDRFAQVRGFKVEISSASGGKEVDTAWESVSGGDLIIEVRETTVGADKFETPVGPPGVIAEIPAPPARVPGPPATPPTTAPGRKSIEEIILRGPMTDRRDALTEWLNDAVAHPNDQRARRDLRLTEIIDDGDGAVKEGRQYIYSDGFPVGYVFPRMSVDNTTGNTIEEVRIKPVRCEPK